MIQVRPGMEHVKTQGIQKKKGKVQRKKNVIMATQSLWSTESGRAKHLLQSGL